jgi:uncharacterized protein (DUF1778 family)
VTTAESRRRNRWFELRTTPAERDLLDRAVRACGCDVTEFVVVHAVDAARRVLADREQFALSEDALAEWETINARRDRELLGLRRLMQRQSPFTE